MRLDAGERRAACFRMIREAEAGDAHRRETGRAHPQWGSGSLMEVARQRAQAAEPGFDDPAYCDALRVVLACLRQTGLSQRRS